MNKALVIGCYGGEHVGDAAILGGVLLRINDTFGVDEVTVASLRPDRTERWIDTLFLPYKINVMQYNRTEIKSLLNQTDCLVFAGGPLMDLPALLLKHLKTTILAQKMGMPIIIEGVGIGPFRLNLSKAIVKHLLFIASHINVRTIKAKEIAKAWGVNAGVNRDPAFDYLQYRITEGGLNNNQILFNEIIPANKMSVGLNLRPLWKKYASKKYSSDEIYKIEEKLLDEITIVINSLSSNARFIFFPMNTDQYGFSDLSIAYRLKDKLSDTADFVIWEFEGGIDDVLKLLSKTFLNVTMRFHASIFSLSVNDRTLGIDYGIGKKSKVSELFEDCKLNDNVQSVEQFQASWLIEKIKDYMKQN